MNSNYQLNLARKWRSKNFDELIGQELVVKILKNSLYRNLLFPVYLLAGPRGCGKTSTARIFATALNCSELQSFQNNPKKTVLPCFSCDSCKSMQKHAHPDFVEIDAASHTGVDNVRQIIEAASYIPVMGKKKIYLIDEAHMLSKAAFNALLKIFEEPPKTALFLLATTDMHKIIDTVKSRCFQLFFHPILSEIIVEHLKKICLAEKISFDEEGLNLIAQESEGSARDALNLIERIRLSGNSLSKSAILDALGFIDDDRLIDIFKLVIQKNVSGLLDYCNKIDLRKFNSRIVFKRFAELVRMSLFFKNGVEVKENPFLKEKISLFIDNCSLENLLYIFEACYECELVFSKTTNPYLLLEMLFVKLCQNLNSSNSVLSSDNQNSSKKKNLTLSSKVESKQESQILKNLDSGLWRKFLNELENLDDPLILSIFRQASSVRLVEKCIELSFSKDLVFFEQLLNDTKDTWKPLIKKCFGNQVDINPVFTHSVVSRVNKTVDKKDIKSMNSINSNMTQNRIGLNKPSMPFNQSVNNIKKRSVSFRLRATEKIVNIKDLENFPVAKMVLEIFPGKILYLE